MGRSWGKPEMDKSERDLLAVLAASDVPFEDQSSILHLLASDADRNAVSNEASSRHKPMLVRDGLGKLTSTGVMPVMPPGRRHAD